MPLEIRLLQDGDIVMLRFVGPLEVHTMREAVRAALLAIQSRPVCFLLDFSAVGPVEPAVLELSSLSEWIYHPNARWFAYVSASGLLKSFARMRHQGNARLFQSAAEAEAFLIEHCST